MSSATIIPVAQALYLSDGHLGFPGGKSDLMGLFNSIRATHYPHVQRQFPQPGIYLVELFCDGQWVADTRVLVH
jgi:hypothetical protein